MKLEKRLMKSILVPVITAGLLTFFSFKIYTQPPFNPADELYMRHTMAETKEVKDKILTLVWDDAPENGSHHYRIEVSKTDLSNPITNLYYEYTKTNQLEIELLDNYSYSFRVQAVTQYGALSDYSPTTPLYIYNKAIHTGIEEESMTNTSLKFSLYQNFPNPFNPTTTIRYNVGEKSNVSLKVYNIAGQKVRTLVDYVQDAGEYEVKFDGKYLSDGLYFIKIKSGNYTSTKKMMLVK